MPREDGETVKVHLFFVAACESCKWKGTPEGLKVREMQEGDRLVPLGQEGIKRALVCPTCGSGDVITYPDEEKVFELPSSCFKIV